jgi:hypothetical protein
MAIKFEYTGKIGSGGLFDEDSIKKVTFELDDNDLTVQELLDEFQNFLKGVGYFLKDTQTFEIIDHDASVTSVKEEVQLPKSAAKPLSVVDDAELAREMDRIRQSTLGLSEEAIEMAAYHALLNRKAE